MLHTIIALEDMFYTPEVSSMQYRTIPYGVAAVSKTPGGEQIQSVFSTDPRVYLNPGYQIGQLYHR